MVTAKIKNSDINQESEKANAIRIAVPVDQTIPDHPVNLALYAFFEQVMFVFDNVLDKDVTSYEYQLYKSDQVTGSFPNYSLINNPTIYLSGESGSNVFSVAVENSTDASNIRYYGRVRTKDTSNNYSSWSPLVLSDQDTPLIGSQFIASLTAAKITAGKIGAHEIILSQAGPQTNIAAPANMAILRSSDYNGSYSSNTWTNGTSGWIIAGDGHAEFSSASIRGGLKAESVYIDANNRWRRNGSDTGSSNQFKVGSNDKYLYFDGTDITLSGNLSAAGGTFTGALSGGTISIGSGNSIFKADLNGIYLGNSTFASSPFRVTPAGVLTANNATITGTINATSGTFTGTLSSANGSFTGTLVTGSVRAGNEAIVSGGSEKGISIQASGLSQWNNAWVQRADNSVYFRAGNETRFIQLDTSGNSEIKFPNFSVNNDGLMTATSVDITGRINATSGLIAGWNLSNAEINSGRSDGYNIYLNSGITGPPELGFVTPSSGTYGIINPFGIYFQDGSSKYFQVNSSNSEVTAVRNGVSVGFNKASSFGGSTYNFVVQDLSNGLNRTFIGPTSIHVVSSSNQITLDGTFGITTGGSVTAQAQVEGSVLIANSGGTSISAPNGSLSVGANIQVGGLGIRYTGPGVAGTNFVAFQWGNPNIYAIIDNAAVLNLGPGISDIRFKTNISSISNECAEKILNKVKVIEYNPVDPLNNNSINLNKKYSGVIAQELIEIFPDLVESHNLSDPNNYLSISYTGFIPYLIKTVQYLNQKIAELEKR